jgi:hypothetical protein
LIRFQENILVESSSLVLNAINFINYYKFN